MWIVALLSRNVFRPFFFRRWQSWVVQNPVIRTADADPTNRFVDRGFGSVNRHHIYHAYSWQKYSTFMFPHIFATAGSILYIFSANHYGINLGLSVCSSHGRKDNWLKLNIRFNLKHSGQRGTARIRIPLLQQSIDISCLSGPQQTDSRQTDGQTDRQTDGRTSYRFIDPAAHTMRAVAIDHQCR